MKKILFLAILLSAALLAQNPNKSTQIYKGDQYLYKVTDDSAEALRVIVLGTGVNVTIDSASLHLTGIAQESTNLLNYQANAVQSQTLQNGFYVYQTQNDPFEVTLANGANMPVTQAGTWNVGISNSPTVLVGNSPNAKLDTVIARLTNLIAESTLFDSGTQYYSKSDSTTTSWVACSFGFTPKRVTIAANPTGVQRVEFAWSNSPSAGQTFYLEDFKKSQVIAGQGATLYVKSTVANIHYNIVGER